MVLKDRGQRMKYFLGIDGGGTKTAYRIVDEAGNCMAQETTTGCSYRDLGMKETVQLLKDGALLCIKKAGIKAEDVTAGAAGLPCYGEFKEEDRRLEEAVKEAFPFCPLYITNDVEVGWAGSLSLRPGINIVSGTGSIAFGKNEKGQSARSGGWSPFFGDEGSCYWLGRRTMELFSKQADKRIEKGPLYEIVMTELDLKEPMEFIGYMDTEYIGERSKVASLQRLLLQAAREGDKAAQALYEEAGRELGSMAESILKQLWTGEQVLVSYSGGLFHAEEFVLPVLREMVEKQNGCLVPPMFSPVHGAVLMAMKMEPEADIERVTEKWMEEMRR